MAATLSLPGVASAAPTDHLVTTGSPPSPFPQNKQNEPGLALDPLNPSMMVAGANDEIDVGPCQGSSCPFTPGVGTSGVYFSIDGGQTWTQPTYQGFSDRTGVPGVGPIGTLPNYFEAGLVSDGDPELTFGPQPDGHGGFSYAHGARLYYANLTSNFPGRQTFAGAEAIAVSHTDNLAAAAAGANSAWSAPVIESRQNMARFSDKESLSADNAQTSPFFGNLYVCNVGFQGLGKSTKAVPEAVFVGRSGDGGQTFTTSQVSAATNNIRTGGRQGCALRTDSHGTVYLVYSGFSIQLKSSVLFEQRSFDGGALFTRPQIVAVTAGIGQFDPVQGRLTIDGVAGSRTSVFPSLDIANGAPTGTGATDEVLLAWSDARAGLNKEQVFLERSTNGGQNFSAPVAISSLAEGRANQPAIAIAPNGSEAFLSYNAYLTDWQSTTANRRPMDGVVRQAPISSGGVPGAFTTVHTGLVGDARGSSANSLTSEFLGDYNYAVASNTSGVAVWNDMRNGTDCPAVDAYRQSLLTNTPLAKPAPPTDCPATFGNSDIFSFTAS
jgi:hypothetical protein